MSTVPPADELRRRLNNFRKLLRERKVPAALITNEKNVRYLSGFTGHDSALLITASKKFLLTDFRYVEEASFTAKGWPVLIEKTRRTKDGKPEVIVPAGLMGKAAYLARKLGIGKLAVEPGDMRIADQRALQKACRGLHVKIKPEDAMVAQLRLIKSDWEVRQIEKALRIQEKCFGILCKEIKKGISERDAAARLRYLMVKEGADDQAFEIMFQIGSNSSLPHGRPTDRKLKGNAIILLDFGCKSGGYHSDLTRTFFLGTIPPQLRKIHGIVMEAQQAAIDRIAPNVEIKSVDAAARDIISKAGFGKAFGHSTGHGLGLDIHEAPSLSWRSNGVLRPGMVVTVEPGIYLPGIGGVRIEDDVLVTASGHRVLSRLKKGLRWNGDN
ncbi:MAG TPA: Xaa-Pro peptidase family protein [Planctomycetota bacterium]|nr:Xaa-Pro peptidase family protein [Planctomycetota bacterium]